MLKVHLFMQGAVEEVKSLLYSTLNKKRYFYLFSLWVVQGVIALIWLFSIPTDSTSYSIPRIALGVLISFVIMISTVFAFKSSFGRWPEFSGKTREFNFAYILSLVAFLLSPVLIVTLRALGQADNFIYIAYAERLTPLAFVLSLSGLEWYVLHLIFSDADFSESKQLLKPFLYILLSFLALSGIIFITSWGLSYIRDGSFGNPPTPLLEWQIVLAILLAGVIMLAVPRWQGKRVDTILFLLVFLSVCLLWLADPLVPGFFATSPRAPNFEPYPFSDALIYSQYAQSALVGEGFLWPDIPTRPFYIAILAWMHALVGQNYYHVIFLQTVLLAFFPAILYLLGSEFGSRSLGLMLALLVTLRDVTANHAAPFALNYSYSKLFFSEVPTALLLAIFTLLAIRWIKTPKPRWYLLVIGGILGVAALIRLQSAVLLAPLALLSGFLLWKARRVEWIRGMFLMVVGLTLLLTPWLVRNYFASGGLVLDNPISQSMVLARRWSGDNGNILIPQQPGETTSQYTSRMTSIALDSFKRDPQRILEGAANHFFNSLISSLHVFPVRDRLESPLELLWPEHAFWQAGASKPVLSVFYAFLLALGLASAWQSHRWVGLLPFGFSLGYNAWTALFLSSGDRFLIPIDWTWILYYCLGILVVLRIAFAGLRNVNWVSSDDKPATTPLSKGSWQQALLVSIVILFVGSSLPLTEKFFPEKYPAQTREQLSSLLNLPVHEADTITYGRAIYPRFYEAGDGEPGSAKLGYGESDEARLVFWMVGPNPGLVIVPLESAPDFFPHASDIWVVGKSDGGALCARIVKVEKDGKSAIYNVP